MTEARLLDGIDTPDDLRRVPEEKLPQLAQEIRDLIVKTTSKTGGHLGAPLGAVELAIALHYVFDTPKDKLVWDVGHQAYAHKILTGRRKRFHTLRQFGGIAGFLERAESEYDAFGAGHASTAISAALGMAVARDLRGSDEKVVAIVGDGALTGGMAFEGLNNAGDLGTDLLIVLNDNNMSISENVGAISSYLTRIAAAPLYQRLKQDVEELLRYLPLVGDRAAELAKNVKERLKIMVVPDILFEEFGFQYFGPVSGHDLASLVPLLRRLKEIRGPVLLHTITHKGKGYDWSETHHEKYHGAKPGFDPETGKLPPKEETKPAPPAYTAVFAEALIREMDRRDDVVAITAAMPSGTGLDKVAKVHPKRVFDVGIAEQHAVTFAAGLAAEGMRPVCAIYSTFLQRAFDQIIHDVGIQNLPVIFALDRAGIVGDDGKTHQGAFDMTYLRLVPNYTIFVPRDESFLPDALRTALETDGIGPFAFRYPRGAGVGTRMPPAPRVLPIGEGEVLAEGKDAFVLGWGPLLYDALAVAKALRREGFSIGVADMRWVKPIDKRLLAEIAGTTRNLLTLEEHTCVGGGGAAVLEALAEMDLLAGARVVRMGMPDAFVEHGRPDLVKAAIGLDRAAIEKNLRLLVSGERLGEVPPRKEVRRHTRA